MKNKFIFIKFLRYFNIYDKYIKAYSTHVNFYTNKIDGINTAWNRMARNNDIRSIINLTVDWASSTRFITNDDVVLYNKIIKKNKIRDPLVHDIIYEENYWSSLHYLWEAFYDNEIKIPYLLIDNDKFKNIKFL